MNSSIDYGFFFDETLNVFNDKDKDSRTRFIQLFRVFKEILNSIISSESQFFSTNFSKLIFIIDKYNINKEDASILKTFRFLAKSKNFESVFKNNKKSNNTDSLLRLAVVSILILIKNKLESTENLLLAEQLIVENRNSAESLIINTNKPSDNKIKLLRAVVKEKSEVVNSGNKIKESILICESEYIEEFKLHLNGKWAEIYAFVKTGDNLNLIDCSFDLELKNCISDKNSIIVLEPDFLFDATELAECFDNNGVSSIKYFMKHFSKSSISPQLLLGNIINSLFDDLIDNPDTDYEVSYETALKNKPLSLFALYSFVNYASEPILKIKQVAYQHFLELKSIVQHFNDSYKTVEPSFISPVYGLQGRLDLLLEYDEIYRKDVVELKSGKAPLPMYSYKNAEGKNITTGVWNNHQAQIECYNLLLDSTFENRAGASSILYSAAFDKPLRNVPNTIFVKQDIIALRNWIYAFERDLANCFYEVFNRLNTDDLTHVSKFELNDLEEFASKYSGADTLLKSYFQILYSFVLREIIYQKIGDNNGHSLGFSALWKNDSSQKNLLFTSVSDLAIDFTLSDFKQLHIFLKRAGKEEVSVFRKGDIAILYPLAYRNEKFKINQQLIKCSIKEINSDYIIISLRNKSFRKEYFTLDTLWSLEPDYIDSTNKTLIKNLYEFFTAERNKVDLILGRRAPEFKCDSDNQIKVATDKYDYLSPNQKEILYKAALVNDYLLIQGPPGTGKTSFMIRSIIQYYFENTQGNILILAYTNRAVDEICSALKRIDTNFPFLRLGSKESSIYTDNLISELSSQMSLRDLFIKVRGCRVWVSTVVSAMTTAELFTIKHFDLAVIDEASQILEPQIIGILSKVDKFIMIGDEKQLPAVVTQSTPENLVDIFLGRQKENREFIKSEFDSICFYNPAVSIFERLIRTAKKNFWDYASETLNYQARMHFDIQSIVNELFYENSLNVYFQDGWQNSQHLLFDSNSQNKLESLLAKERIIFLNSDFENNFKIHNQEAECTAQLAERIQAIYKEQFDNNSLGIITPFRAQIANIYSLFPDNNLRNIVHVDTVERFQGSERDIIIFSLSVNYLNQLKAVQSLVEFNNIIVDRKLNVALTRAKSNLIIIGNENILNKSSVYEQLITLIKSKYLFTSITEFEKLYF